MRDACLQFQLALLEETSRLPERRSDHASSCEECRSFYLVHRTLGPPADLVARTFSRLEPVLRERRALRRKLALQLCLAGAVSLPVVVGMNAVLVWLCYVLTSHVISPEAGAVAAGIVGSALLLGLSLAYGSLPLLASWGSHLRERTA